MGHALLTSTWFCMVTTLSGSASQAMHQMPTVSPGSLFRTRPSLSASLSCVHC